MKMKVLTIFLLQIINEVMSSEEEIVNCTGTAIIRDFDNRPHSFDGNETNIVMHAVKESVISISGTCCFSLFSKKDGYGENQIVGPEGEYRLDLDDLKSIFRLECEGPLIHPVLKFILIVIAVVAILYFIYTKGKEHLWRRRV